MLLKNIRQRGAFLYAFRCLLSFVTIDYDVYIYRGGFNGVEFCKTITDSFVVNGSMFDDGTTFWLEV